MIKVVLDGCTTLSNILEDAVVTISIDDCELRFTFTEEGLTQETLVDGAVVADHKASYYEIADLDNDEDEPWVDSFV